MQLTNTLQSQAPADIGYDLIGPIMHRYFLGLHSYMQYFEGDDAIFLYCARAGVRIRTLLDLCAGASNWPAVSHSCHFWISRILACKGLFSRIPTLSAQHIAK